MWENPVMVTGSRPTVMNLGGAWSRRALLLLLVITLHRVFTIVHLKRNMFLGYTVLQLLCSHNYGTCNVTFHYECFVLLLSNVHCPVWLSYAVFVFLLSRYVAQVCSKWFWDGSSCSYYYWQHSCSTFLISYISIARSSYFRILYASFLSHLCLTKL